MLAQKSLKLLKSVDVSSSCRSLCSYKGNTYCGLQHNTVGESGVAKIDENFVATKLFTTDESVRSVTAYRDKLYAFTRNNSCHGEMRVYTLHGKQVTCWYHRDESKTQSQFVIIDDQVVIPDGSKKLITVYSLAGKVVKYIPCSLLDKDSRILICAADNHCVVVSDSSQVFKLDLTTEKVMWTCEDVSKPQALTCYRSKYILVTNQSKKTTIWILDVKTG